MHLKFYLIVQINYDIKGICYQMHMYYEVVEINKFYMLYVVGKISDNELQLTCIIK